MKLNKIILGAAIICETTVICFGIKYLTSEIGFWSIPILIGAASGYLYAMIKYVKQEE